MHLHRKDHTRTVSLRVKRQWQHPPDTPPATSPLDLQALVFPDPQGENPALHSGGFYTQLPVLSSTLIPFITEGKTAHPPVVLYVLFMKTLVGVS